MKKMLNLLKEQVRIDTVKTNYKITVLNDGDVITLNYKALSSIGVEKYVRRQLSGDIDVLKVELA